MLCHVPRHSPPRPHPDLLIRGAHDLLIGRSWFVSLALFWPGLALLQVACKPHCIPPNTHSRGPHTECARGKHRSAPVATFQGIAAFISVCRSADTTLAELVGISSAFQEAQGMRVDLLLTRRVLSAVHRQTPTNVQINL